MIEYDKKKMKRSESRKRNETPQGSYGRVTSGPGSLDQSFSTFFIISLPFSIFIMAHIYYSNGKQLN